MLKKIEIMIMIMISYNVLQKRLISQKYKKYSPGKYAMLLYVAVSIRWISIRFGTMISRFESLIYAPTKFLINFQVCVRQNFAHCPVLLKHEENLIKS